jgi:hypothetical protein
MVSFTGSLRKELSDVQEGIENNDMGERGEGRQDER